MLMKICENLCCTYKKQVLPLQAGHMKMSFTDLSALPVKQNMLEKWTGILWNIHVPEKIQLFINM